MDIGLVHVLGPFVTHEWAAIRQKVECVLQLAHDPSNHNSHLGVLLERFAHMELKSDTAL